MKIKIHHINLLLLLFISCSNNTSTSENNSATVTPAITPIIEYNAVNLFPHDTASFTEGFLIHKGLLYESTGADPDLPQTNSLFGVVNFKTGKIAAKVVLDKKIYFGEGIAFFGEKAYQLTYKTKIGFVYDAKTFKQLSTFSFDSKEGWGMTADSANLLMSDGTSQITYLDPATLKAVKKITVTNENGPIENINELEYIKGFIYANVYGANVILKIDPATGKVKGKLDLTTLVNQEKNQFSGALQLNGIAYDPLTDKIYVTGKMWPHIYEIRFEH
jgi:glutamine cyclotransferase